MEGVQNPEPKRRKIRKGTQSCWECKRRKIKCSFAIATSTICDGCKSRGTYCVSQAIPSDDAGPPDRSAKTSDKEVDKLRRMEAMVEKLVEKADDEGSQGLTTQTGEIYGDKSRAGAFSPTCRKLHGKIQDPMRSCMTSATPSLTLSNQERAGYNGILEPLLRAWPSQRELELIVRLPVSVAVLFHGTLCMPHSKLLSQETSPLPAREILKPPLPGSHPVLVARKLLLLATFLRGAPHSNAVQQDYRQGLGIERRREIRLRAVETAISLVISKDELVVDSLEGVECIMMQSMYHNNEGDLRQAWLTNRRAMAIAQLMGLHKGASMQDLSVKVLEPETETRISPEHMWFRLVCSDRYLSLMLGLPQAHSEDEFVKPMVLDRCTSLERLERLDCVAGGCILQRTPDSYSDIHETQGIDNMLRQAAACMPAQWWLTPDINVSTDKNDSGVEPLLDTLRLMSQFAHYYILLRLHLPYLLCSSAQLDRNYDYNKLTAMHASREILTRFVAFFGSSMSAISYCRGVDFLALVASAALCLGHIDVDMARQIGPDKTSNVSELLAHQYLSDQGLLEKTLKSMDDIVQLTGGADAIARRVAEMLRHLLATEADAHEGVLYNRVSLIANTGRSEELGCRDELLYGGRLLRIHVPYLGIIEIERDRLRESVSELPRPGLLNRNPVFNSLPFTETLEESIKYSQSRPVDSTTRSRSGCPSPNPGSQAASSFFNPIEVLWTAQLTNNSEITDCVDEAQIGSQVLMTSLETNVDEGGLQGVDVAFLKTIFQGTVDPFDTTEELS